MMAMGSCQHQKYRNFLLLLFSPFLPLELFQRKKKESQRDPLDSLGQRHIRSESPDPLLAFNATIVSVDKHIKMLLDQSVSWLYNAYTSLDNKVLVKKVSKRIVTYLCESDDFRPLRCVGFEAGIFRVKV